MVNQIKIFTNGATCRIVTRSNIVERIARFVNERVDKSKRCLSFREAIIIQEGEYPRDHLYSTRTG